MKPLRILLGNQTLALLAGSETWTLTLAFALKKLGHEVECFSPRLGIISEKLKAADIPCHSSMEAGSNKPFSVVLEPARNFDYDVIISNHNEVVSYLRSRFPRKPIISTIHGIMHTMKDRSGKELKAPEHPALEAGVNQFVAVSEEVQEKLRAEYNIDSTIIRNFFDLKKFNVKRPITADKPKQFLVNTNYADARDPEIELIRQVVKHYGAKLSAVGQNFAQTDDLTRAIEDADVVVGMGRSVLEGVCAGRLGIVHGRWGTGGIICEENLDVLRRCNFSGRNSEGRMMTKEEMIAEIDKHYNARTIAWGRDYIVKNHNAVTAAEAYVAIARSLLGQDIIPAGVVAKPYRRARDVKQTA